MPHLQVSDVATSVARAVELGGRELMRHHGDEWAVLVDPVGAAFGVIPAVAQGPNGASRTERIGRISWLSLVVRDVSSTCTFYEQVVGWAMASPLADGDHEMLRPDGVAAAEIRAMDGDEEIPSVWLLSLPVDDFAESLRQVREGGGEIVREDAASAVIRDPVGVYVALQGDP